MTEYEISEIELLAGSTVVPVTCGGYHGTAFFFASNLLLTAKHVVLDAEMDDSESIYIVVCGRSEECSLKYISKDLDYAILETKTHLCSNDSILELLAIPFIKGAELAILGYPQEIGNGVDNLCVLVTNRNELKQVKREFNVVVNRKEASFMKSYKGFSGSPVLNSKRKVIGIVTDQFTGSLGYLSLEHIVRTDDQIGDYVSKDWLMSDTRNIGVGGAFNGICKALEKAKSRYDAKLHQPDEELSEFLFKFAGFDEKDYWIELWLELDKLYKDFVTKFDYDLKSQFDKLMTHRGERITIDLLEPIRKNQNLSSFLDKDIRRFANIYDSVYDIDGEMVDADNHFLYLYGLAGSGKTHYLCHFAKDLSSKTQTYLMFGSDFNAQSDAKDTMLNLMGVTESDVQFMQQSLTTDKRYAVIIIDAINEGAGVSYWDKQIDSLVDFINKFDRLKLIISIRGNKDNTFISSHLDSWVDYPITGFKNLQRALDSFFSFYNISPSFMDLYYNVGDFKNPQFLHIFCKAFRGFNHYAFHNIGILDIYLRYLEALNVKVSEDVDEDPELNVTTKYMQQLMRLSVDEFVCNVVPKSKARMLSDEMSPHSGWERSLLHVLEKENLLMQTYSYQRGEACVMVEYEKLEDFLKAMYGKWLTKVDVSDIDTINRIKKYHIESVQPSEGVNPSKVKNFLVALLSIWKPKDISILWSAEEFSGGVLTEILLESLMYRRYKQYDICFKIFENLVNKEESPINAGKLLKLLNFVGEDAMLVLHNKLNSLAQEKLDLFWTPQINNIDKLGAIYKYGDLEYIGNDSKASIGNAIALSWFCASSFPIVRAFAIRALVTNLRQNPKTALRLMEIFAEVRDVYVLEGIYAAIYGMTLRLDNRIIKSIAINIYERFYDNNAKAPEDLYIRQWTLKIIDRASSLFGLDLWDKIKAYKGFESKNSPMVNEDEDYHDQQNYFGSKGNGSSMLYYSIFDESDFKRYIIGTNNHIYSPEFYIDEKSDEGVKLSWITNSVANYVKNTLKWSDNLSEIDNYSSQTRFSNITERIGKKYQWIALRNVICYLSDTCVMKNWRKEKIELHFPWYSEYINHLDPSISDTELQLHSDLTKKLQIKKKKVDLLKFNVNDWAEEARSVVFSYFDSDNVEWIPIIAFNYADIKVSDGETLYDFYILNPLLIPTSKTVEFEKWGEQQDFTGRWLPEAHESNDFLWNEYPWSDSFLNVKKQNELQRNQNRVPFDYVLPYLTQLQEDYMGLQTEDRLSSSVYMLCEDMMHYFNAYNAERGVVRISSKQDELEQNENKILAFNTKNEGRTLDALLIRKDFFMQYLKDRKYSLYYCVGGEKYGTFNKKNIGLHQFSGLYRFDCEGRVSSVSDYKLLPPINK